MVDIRLDERKEWAGFVPEDAKQAKVGLVQSGQASSSTGGTRGLTMADLTNFLGGTLWLLQLV